MKLFARQLMHKHQYLRWLTEDVEETERALDSMISFDMFLNVASLSQKTVKVLNTHKHACIAN